MRPAHSLGSLQRRSLEGIREQDVPEVGRFYSSTPCGRLFLCRPLCEGLPAAADDMRLSKQGMNVGEGQTHETARDVEAGGRILAALERTSVLTQPLLQRGSSHTEAPAAPDPAAHKAGEAAALTAKARDFSNAVVFGVINGIVGMSNSCTRLHVMSYTSHVLHVMCTRGS